jgi:hypothetical protein
MLVAYYLAGGLWGWSVGGAQHTAFPDVIDSAVVKTVPPKFKPRRPTPNLGAEQLLAVIGGRPRSSLMTTPNPVRNLDVTQGSTRFSPARDLDFDLGDRDP